MFAGQIAFASSERGRVSIALSRPTPREAFAHIAGVRLPGRGVDLFQVDERRAKKGTDDRNLALVEKGLESWVMGARLRRMPVDGPWLVRGARRYAVELEETCGRPPVIDLVHLGLGPDGHTASLIPGDPVLDVRDRWVATTKRHNRFRRMTFTYPVLDAARLVVFVVGGAEKADALARVLRGDRSAPAARVAASNQLFLVDRAAASGLR